MVKGITTSSEIKDMKNPILSKEKVQLTNNGRKKWLTAMDQVQELGEIRDQLGSEISQS